MLDLKIPGLGAGGTHPDRFRASAETLSRAGVDALRAMVKELAAHGEFELLRARMERRITTLQLLQAYKRTVGSLEELKKALKAEERRLEPLLTDWAAVLSTGDRAKTLTQVNRFIVWARGQKTGATLEALSSETIALFLVELTAARKNAAPVPANWQTKDRYRAALSGFCTWLVGKGRLDKHPIKAKGVPPERKKATRRLPDMRPEDYAAYFDGLLKTRPFEGRDHIEQLREQLTVFFRMLIHTGADVGELRTVVVSDVQFGETRQDGTAGLTHIRLQRPKTYTEVRRVPYPQACVSELRSFIAGRGLQRGDLLFDLRATKCKSGYILPDVVAAHRLARKAIGQPLLRVKDLRHVAAISWARAGFPIQRISRWLGHSTLQQTMIYENYLPEDSEIEDAVERAADRLSSVARTDRLKSPMVRHGQG